jgi:hypothetical protein
MNVIPQQLVRPFFTSMVVVVRAERRSVEREVHGDRRIFLGSQQTAENLGGRARKVGQPPACGPRDDGARAQGEARRGSVVVVDGATPRPAKIGGNIKEL